VIHVTSRASGVARKNKEPIRTKVLMMSRHSKIGTLDARSTTGYRSCSRCCSPDRSRRSRDSNGRRTFFVIIGHSFNIRDGIRKHNRHDSGLYDNFVYSIDRAVYYNYDRHISDLLNAVAKFELSTRWRGDDDQHSNNECKLPGGDNDGDRMQHHDHGNYHNDRDLYYSSRSHCNDHRNSNVNKLRLDSDHNGLPNHYNDDHHDLYNFASFITITTTTVTQTA
jgi:hypothetical protein